MSIIIVFQSDQVIFTSVESYYNSVLTYLEYLDDKGHRHPGNHRLNMHLTFVVTFGLPHSHYSFVPFSTEKLETMPVCLEII